MKNSYCLAAAASVLLSASLLSSCVTDQFLQKDLPTVCKDLKAAHSTFTLVTVVFDKVPAKLVSKELAIYQGVKAICVDPEHTDTLDAVALVSEAYAKIKAALDDPTSLE